jgi:RHS repeat-associated protein
VTDTYDYDAWGNLVNSTGSTSNVYLYRAEQWDPDLGLYCQRARYFNPVSGRFLSRDTYEGNQNTPARFHKYIYASADPVDRSDPSGRLDSGEYATSLRYADEVGKIIAPRAIGPGLVAVSGIGASIGCVWNKAAGWRSANSLCPAHR